MYEHALLKANIQQRHQRKSKAKEQAEPAQENAQQPTANQNNLTPFLSDNSTQNNSYSYSSSDSQNTSVHYSRSSGHKKQQSFQDLMKETIFTEKRGSPDA